VRQARDDEMSAVAAVWYRGLGEEEGSPWADYLKKWTPNSAAKWFLDATKRQGARMLVAETDGKIVAMNGIVFEKRSGIARFFTGVVVAPENRRRGVGSLLLHSSLVEAKKEGLRTAEVETIQGIPAVRYLYPKFGGNQKTVTV
jgi:GNAT superfamily N-acetyltransferase